MPSQTLVITNVPGYRSLIMSLFLTQYLALRARKTMSKHSQPINARKFQVLFLHDGQGERQAMSLLLTNIWPITSSNELSRVPM